ncbi:MAG: hypothetical protein DWQ06_07105 [Calditrichaeota bacterium]|nr:MAG: hypothetical protein DWQ06_07105 [Calditrichota bacterium]
MKKLTKIIGLTFTASAFVASSLVAQDGVKKGNYPEAFEKAVLKTLQVKAKSSYDVVAPIAQGGDLDNVQEGVLFNTFKLALGDDEAKNQVSELLVDMVQNYNGNSALRNLGLSKTASDEIAASSGEGARSAFDDMSYEQILKESTKYMQTKYDMKPSASKNKKDLKEQIALKEARNAGVEQGEKLKQKEMEVVLNALSSWDEKSIKANLGEKLKEKEIQAVVKYIQEKVK